MSSIKPIETKYKGFRFRSRLEARWAVYFDAMRIPWEYEPEGFDLGDLGWYLPDFHLYEKNIFAEVKPIGGDVEVAKAKLEALVNLAVPVEFDCVLLDGPPEVRPYEYAMHVGYQSDPVWGCLVLVNYRPGREDRPWWSPGIGVDQFADELFVGVAAARGARFEHGETP